MSQLAYYIIYPLIWLFSLLPLRVLYLFGWPVYVLNFYVFKYRKKVVKKNLRNSFPEKSEAEISDICKKFYKYFSRLLMESIKLISIPEKELRRRIIYKNPELLEELFNAGKFCVVVTAHFGNWEWLTGLAKSSPFRAMSLYKPLSNKYMEKIVNNMRSRTGTELVPMSQALKKTLAYIQSGTPAISVFISDQRPYIRYIQYWTKFLNQDTAMYLGVEKIARKTKQAVIFYKMIPLKPGYYEVEVIKLFDNAATVPEYVITEAHTKILEQMICEKPEYWLWTHNRWKYKYTGDKPLKSVAKNGSNEN